MTARRAVVVGAGLSGLMAARTLAEHDWNVTVLDKGRGVGGRMATRRITALDGRVAIFDHGAQFFTVRDPRFESLVNEWVRVGVVREWCRGFAGDDGHPRYVVNNGMTALTKHLANGLDVRTSNLVFAVKPGTTTRWTVVVDDGSELDADAVVMTCPLPQSYSLTVTTGVELPNELLLTDYDRTIGLLAVLDAPPTIPAPGGLQNPDTVFSWIGDNVAKGISPIPAVTFHANPEWSAQHWDDDAETGLTLLTEAAAPYLGGATIVASEYKKWRFATPKKLWPEPCHATADDTLVFAGDAFAGPKVEGAVLSGLAAGAVVANA
ncbi:MAG: FAD-dependent oxidoreductase [Acidimicrobiia bacterium]|nr:FAD-dependent oxidoreductase [Acidimicrobiia bacterium]